MKSTHGGEGGKKCLVGPKEQRKWQEEHMEGTGGSRGCADIWAVPRQGPALPSLLLGVPPCPNPGGSGRRWYHSHQPLTARVVTKSSLQLQVGPRAGSCCVLSLAGSCWELFGGLELNLGAENSKWRHSHGVSQLREHTWGRRGNGWGRQTKPDQYDFVCK